MLLKLFPRHVNRLGRTRGLGGFQVWPSLNAFELRFLAAGNLVAVPPPTLLLTPSAWCLAAKGGTWMNKQINF